MTEPRRWLDDARTSAELRRVLESATNPPPLPKGLHAELCEFTSGLASQSILTKVGGGSLWHKLFVAGSSSGKVMAVLVVVGAAGVATYPTQSQRAPSARSAPQHRPLVRAPSPSPSTASVALPTEAAPAASERGKPIRSAPGRTASHVDAGSVLAEQPERVVPSTTGIAEEAKLLESARSFLGDSPALALDLTERHRLLYPQGQLTAEREFIAIDALVRSGRHREAEERAAPWLASSPDSVYARRLRKLLGNDEIH